MNAAADKGDGMSEDAILEFADNILRLAYNDIPTQVADTTKNSILDILGTTIAGSGIGAGCKELVELAKEGGGRKESTILVHGEKVPCWMAAFANAAMAHALDYDDLHYQGMIHPTLTTLPAALSVAEPRKVSGQQFLKAIILGNDLVSRLALAHTSSSKEGRQKWVMTPVFGVFGSTAACGSILKLDRNQLVSAFGIALQNASGTREIGGPGSIYRGLYGSKVALSGVLSTLMAQRGITTSKNSLESRYGLYSAYFDGSYNREVLLSDLGKKFEGSNITFKAWPSCGHSLCHIDATLQLVNEHPIRTESIAEITVFVAEESMPLCEPLESRQKPPTSLDAKWSIPWTVACAATHGKVTLSNFTSEGLRDPAVVSMAQKVKPVYDQSLNTTHRDPPAIVEIKTKEGQSFSKRVDYAYGYPENPMRRDDLLRKFNDCVSYSARPFSRRVVEEIADMVENLEEVKDINKLVRLLSY